MTSRRLGSAHRRSFGVRGWDRTRRRADPAPPGRRLGAEPQVQPAAAVDVGRAQVGGVPGACRSGWRTGRTGAAGRARCRRRRSASPGARWSRSRTRRRRPGATARSNAGALTRNRFCPATGNRPERRPHVPGAQPAGVVVARQAARGRCRTARSARRAPPRRCGPAGPRSGRPTAPPCPARCSAPRSGSARIRPPSRPASGRRPGCFTGSAPYPKNRSSMPTNAASPPASAIRAAMSCSSRNE